jgi:hypothetical protein
MKFIRNAILRWARNRKPDFIIGGQDNPYLRRHWLLPRNRFFNVYVHEFLRSDDDRALHDHPWLFNASWLIDGSYTEWMPADDEHLQPDITERCAYPESRVLRRGDWKFRWGGAPHRIELFDEVVPDADSPETLWLSLQPMPVWTVFFTGPVVRMWGFHCPGRGWIDWKRFTAADDPGAVGKGCDA